ncbi:MAG: phosphoribosyltransferase family protein [Bacillota bacterium]
MFADRNEAGKVLAKAIRDELDPAGHKVLGIPRGGVTVAAEVAESLGLQLAPVNAVKIRAPWNPEFAIGAIAEGIEPLMDPDWSSHPRLAQGSVERAVAEAREDLARRRDKYGTPGEIEGCPVIVVDDGAATGYTVLAAARSLRAAGVSRLVIALPVASPDAAALLRGECDQLLVHMGLQRPGRSDRRRPDPGFVRGHLF